MLKPSEEDEADAKALVEQLVRSHARLPPPQRPSLALLVRRIVAFEYTLCGLERVQRGEHLHSLLPSAPPAAFLPAPASEPEAEATSTTGAGACACDSDKTATEMPAADADADGSQAQAAASPSEQQLNDATRAPSEAAEASGCDVKPSLEEQPASEPAATAATITPEPLPAIAEDKEGEDEKVSAAIETESVHTCSPSKTADASATNTPQKEKDASGTASEPPLAMPLPCLDAALQAFQDDAQAMCVLFSSCLSNFIAAVGEKVRKRRHTTQTGGASSSASASSGAAQAGVNEDTNTSQGDSPNLNLNSNLLMPLSSTQPVAATSGSTTADSSAGANGASGLGSGVPAAAPSTSTDTGTALPFTLITQKELAELGIGVRRARTLLRPLFLYAKRYSMKAGEAFRTARAELSKCNFDPRSGAH